MCYCVDSKEIHIYGESHTYYWFKSVAIFCIVFFLFYKFSWLSSKINEIKNDENVMKAKLNHDERLVLWSALSFIRNDRYFG